MTALSQERTEIEAHQDYELGMPIAYHYPADIDDVVKVMAQSPNDENGRSDWRWIRLDNGDLALALFPQGETYMELERTFQ